MTSTPEENKVDKQPPVHDAQYRTIDKKVMSMTTSDGAGVKLRRSIGTPLLDSIDPFLMLDEFRSDDPGDYIAGFPDHPHRGFETVTYMLAGSMRHRDSRGNQGDLGPGSVQWMTAGRGIVHSEMPRQENGLMWGFQLWVNLPARDKMKEPSYQDIDASRIPEVDLDNGTRIRVIAGKALGVEGAVKGIAIEPLYLDINIPAECQFELELPENHHAFVYVFEGEADFGAGNSQPVSRGELGVLSQGSSLRAVAGDRAARFLLVAGKPIGEPVVKHGPFVMNTVEEIQQAIMDYQSNRFD